MSEHDTVTEPLLLIASPQMRDPIFEGALVLLWHHDAEGAAGIVVNRPLEHHIDEVIHVDPELDLTPYSKIRVNWGGPVEGSSGTVLTQTGLVGDEGMELPHGLALTHSQEVLTRILKQGGPVMLCLGYAGWGPGQLGREMEEGAWLWTDCNAELVLHTPAEQRYDAALATLGLCSHSVLMTPGYT